MHRLQDKKCLITGAARGIGEAIAAAFVEEGAEVVVTDKDGASGEATARRLGAQFHLLDVAREEDWRKIEDAHARLDVLVNNAGITGLEENATAHDPEHASLAAWRAVHRVNSDGTFLGCRYGIRAMKHAGEGSIINLSSRSGMVGIPAAAAYASSKASIRNHTKTVALYCAAQGWNIRCNSIHPAAVLTPMWDPMLAGAGDRDEAIATLVSDTPLRRFGAPEEVAAVAILLASDEAKYITGSELTIDGGILAGSAASPVRSED